MTHKLGNQTPYLRIDEILYFHQKLNDKWGVSFSEEEVDILVGLKTRLEGQINTGIIHKDLKDVILDKKIKGIVSQKTYPSKGKEHSKPRTRTTDEITQTVAMIADDIIKRHNPFLRNFQF